MNFWIAVPIAVVCLGMLVVIFMPSRDRRESGPCSDCRFMFAEVEAKVVALKGDTALLESVIKDLRAELKEVRCE